MTWRTIEEDSGGEELVDKAASVCRAAACNEVESVRNTSTSTDPGYEVELGQGGVELTPAKTKSRSNDVALAISKLLVLTGCQQDGDTPLRNAVSGGHVGIVELLLKAGSKVNSSDEVGDTALHNSASTGRLNIADLLLTFKANVDSRNELQDTPLTKACEGGHIGIVEILLNAGAKVNHVNLDKDTPLHKATSGGHDGVVELLLHDNAQLNSTNKNGETPLHNAVDGGHVGLVERLLKAKAKTDITDIFEATPLHGASEGGHIQIVELLLNHGARVDAMDKVGRVPLHLAADEGNVDVAESILEKKPEVDSRDKVMAAPLHMAASGGHIDVVELLLNAGAKVDSRDENGNTPLHDAASEGHADVADLLLKVGAKVDSRNEKKATVHPKVNKRQGGAAQFVIETDAQGGSKSKKKATPLHKAADGGHVDVSKLLLNFGALVNSKDEFKNTPLHKAASAGHVGVADLLIKKNAQKDSVNKVKATPLHLAATGGHVGVVELLLSAGAQVDSTNQNGMSPKDIAIMDTFPGQYPNRKIASCQEGRQKIGPNGGKLQTASCAVIVPPGALSRITEFTCQVVKTTDVNIPLEADDLLVSDIIELGPHGTRFSKPVTVEMHYSSTPSEGTREFAIWATDDKIDWTVPNVKEKSEDKLTVAVDHFSIFAVISRLKHDQVTVSTEGCILTSSTQPAVEITFPEQSVQAPIEIKMQVRDVPKEQVDDMKLKDPSMRSLISTGPIVKVGTLTSSTVQFYKPVTVRVPHPRHYMSIEQREPLGTLRVMSCEEEEGEWVDITDDANIRDMGESVAFDVNHFSRYLGSCRLVK
ncbi:ankyrin-1-like [Branchiostoma floridae]|uniref:Ankyrin-1-like n=1 Tax=Branchiostoma floridae TaxID=7739 RepID=A0A9J7N5U7_BRAFL|nr:ankyrin-1-like [Branchiostoma floridae]